ncbi:hypothetical protein BC829DRAFT_228594 [Chytridium lagenaria]|nr:hypothetical protein BC829DRAFT_228594 [Chytridium lagenaria]
MLILFSLCEDIGVEKFLKVIERDSGRLLGGMCKYVEVCLQEHFLEYETVDMVMDRDGKEHSVHAILERLLEHVLDVDEKAVENLLAGKIGEGEGGSVMERALRRSWRSAKEGERLESLVAVKLLSKIAQKAGDDERGRIFEGLTQSAAEENSSSELELALLSQLPKDLDKVVDKNFQKALRAMAGWAKTDPVEKMDEVTRTLRTVLVLGDYVVRTESTLEDFVDEHVGVQALRRLRGLLDTTNVTVVPPMFLKYSLQLFSRFFSGGWTFDVNFQRFISSLVGKIVDEFSFYSPEAAFLIHEAFIFFGEAEKWEVWEAFGLNERDIRLCALRLALEGPDLKSSNFVAPTTFEKIIDVMHECFKHEIGERDLVAVAPAQVIKMLAVESDGCGKVAFQILSMLAARNVEGMILKVEQRTEVSEGELLGIW